MTEVKIVRVYNRKVPSGITASAFTQKGELLAGTGAGTYVAKAPGANGKYLKYDSSEVGGITADTPSLEVQDTTNHLINGGFGLAQRQSPGTLTDKGSDKYSADRWRVVWEFPSATNWQTAFNYALNDVCKPTVYNGFYYKCTNDAGSSGGAEPTWPTTPGGTVVDGGITWTCMADLQYIRQDGSGESSLLSPYYGQFKKITNAGKILICQPLEFLDTLKFRGKTISFQLKMKASASKTIKISIVELQAAGVADTLPSSIVSTWNIDGTNPGLGANLANISTPVSCAVTTEWQTFQFSADFPATSKNLLVMIWTDADFAVNDTLSLAEAALYFGATQRSWIPRIHAQEIELCRRYYQKTFDVDTGPAQNAGAQNSARILAGKAGALGEYGEWKFPITMRTTPNVISYNPQANNDQVRDVIAGADCSGTLLFPFTNVVFVNTTGNGLTAVGNILNIHLAAEADL